MGRVLGVPEVLIEKVPSDGLSGMTDEDKLGFTYEVLDRYIRTGEIENVKTKERIDMLHERNLFSYAIWIVLSMMGSGSSHLAIITGAKKYWS